MKINIINRSPYTLPEYQTAASAGMDLRASIEESIILESLERKIVPTGLFLELPEGFEAQIRPRSGLAAKQGITVLNSPGTIDADYRGEIGVILINHGTEFFVVKTGDRIAQLVLNKVEQIEWSPATTLTGSHRGANGFGSTGNK